MDKMIIYDDTGQTPKWVGKNLKSFAAERITGRDCRMFQRSG